jgi:hypothetical protein
VANEYVGGATKCWKEAGSLAITAKRIRAEYFRFLKFLAYFCGYLIGYRGEACSGTGGSGIIYLLEILIIII